MLGTDRENAVNSVIEEIDATTLNQDAIDDLQIEKAKAIGALDAYVQLYANDPDRFSKYQTEKSFKVKMMMGVLYHVTIDMLCKDSRGWWIMDHKTAATINDDYLQQASIASQTLGYAFGAYRLLGEWPVGIIYNIIGKTRIRPYKAGKTRKKAETLKEFCVRQYQQYQRHFLDPGHKDYTPMFLREEFMLKKKRVKEWFFETKEILKQMDKDFTDYKNNPEMDWIFYKNTGSCFKFQNSCKYLPICTSGGKVSAATRMLYDVDGPDAYMEKLEADSPIV
jgi:hypothetical protein